MPIEFLCSSCNQQLRVPDGAAGKNARCPKCATVLAVPAGSGGLSPLAPPPQAGFNFGPPEQEPMAVENSLRPAVKPPAFGGGLQNPYASPQGTYQAHAPMPAGPVGHQIVEVNAVINHAVKVWQNNLGIAIGMFLLPVVVLLPAMGFGFAAVILIAQLDVPALTVILAVFAYLAIFALQTFLNIGQAQMCLKLARGEAVGLGELFSGGARFLPVLAFSLLAGLVLTVAMLPLYVPAVILLLYFWPSYHLVLEGKCDVMESFGIARRITEGNKLTTFVLVLVSYGFLLIGELACLVGLIFAAPLVFLIWSTAYLMMSGQIPVPPLQQPYVPQQPMYR